MLLGVIPMICFEILSDFKRKSQKGEIGKSCISSPQRGRGAQKGTPRVRYSVAFLQRENFWILFRKSRIRTPIV